MSLARPVRRVLVRIAGLAMLVGSAGSAQAALPDLADVTSVSCTFAVRATGTWTDGVATVELDAPALSLRFEAIDVDGATAEIVGPYGASHIITRLTGDYLHLVQMFNAGPLYTTTLIDRETTDGKFMAVHTRHEYTDVRMVGFTSRPEQYYGECSAGE